MYQPIPSSFPDNKKRALTAIRIGGSLIVEHFCFRVAEASRTERLSDKGTPATFRLATTGIKIFGLYALVGLGDEFPHVLPVFRFKIQAQPAVLALSVRLYKLDFAKGDLSGRAVEIFE